MEPREGCSFETGTRIQDFAPFIGEARGLFVELNLVFGEEGEEVLSIAREHEGIRDLGFLLVANFVGENRPIVEFALQGIMPRFQRFDIIVKGF